MSGVRSGPTSYDLTSNRKGEGWRGRTRGTLIVLGLAAYALLGIIFLLAGSPFPGHVVEFVIVAVPCLGLGSIAIVGALRTRRPSLQRIRVWDDRLEATFADGRVTIREFRQREFSVNLLDIRARQEGLGDAILRLPPFWIQMAGRDGALSPIPDVLGRNLIAAAVAAGLTVDARRRSIWQIAGGTFAWVFLIHHGPSPPGSNPCTDRDWAPEVPMGQRWEN
jgi:hypothetical protein